MGKKFVNKKNFVKKVYNHKPKNVVDNISVPNCYFGHVNDKFAGYNKETLDMYKRQRIERGFDDTELFNLDSTLANYIIPRLEVFKEKVSGYPFDFDNLDGWKNCIQKMITSFKMSKNIDFYIDNLIIDMFGDKYSLNPSDENFFYVKCLHNEENEKDYDLFQKRKDELFNEKQEGLMLFAKYFNDLWW